MSKNRNNTTEIETINNSFFELTDSDLLKKLDSVSIEKLAEKQANKSQSIWNKESLRKDLFPNTKSNTGLRRKARNHFYTISANIIKLSKLKKLDLETLKDFDTQHKKYFLSENVFCRFTGKEEENIFKNSILESAFSILNKYRNKK